MRASPFVRLALLAIAAGTPLEHSSSLSRVQSDDGAERPLVVIASEQMDADPGWRPLAPGELTHVMEGLQVRSRQILDGPPVRTLTLEDLAPGARASQARAQGSS